MMVDYPHFKMNSNINSQAFGSYCTNNYVFQSIKCAFCHFFQMNKPFLGPQIKSLKNVLKIVHATPYSNDVPLKQ